MSQKHNKPCSVEQSSRRIIENKLLDSLSDDSKVALVCDLSDLNALIDALSRMAAPTEKQASMRRDLMQLRKVAFDG